MVNLPIMLSNTKNNTSRFTYLCCMLVMCYASFFFYPRWKNVSTEAAISWDVSGYYWYLPSIFIYHDLKQQTFKDSILKKYGPTNTDFQQAMQLPNGNYVMKYAAGMAIMYLPFFTAAHLVAAPLGYPADGFSTPYQFAIQFGGLLISLIGLWYLRKLLLIFYEDKVVAVTIALLVIGTNYLNYGAIDCGMSHCWLFTIYVFILLNTHYFYQSFKKKYAIRIGLLVGLATLTRPSDLLSCLIPILWGLESLSFSAIKSRVKLFMEHYTSFIIAGISAVCVMSIQLIYWKYVSGHWIVYSYNNQHLYFRSPNIVDYTFSYRSGWLTYTPLMIFAFIGIIPFLRNGTNKVAVVAFFLLNYYIVCSWNIWWYGGRAMVQSYPVLLFLIAALVNAAMSKKIAFWAFSLFSSVFIYFNIWTTYFYHKGTLYDTESMSEAYFWRAIGRWNAPENIALLKENPELFEGTIKNGTVIYSNHFDKDTGAQYIVDPNTNRRSLPLTKEHQNSPVYKFPFSGNTARWLRVNTTFHCVSKEGQIWNMAQCIVRLMYKGAIVKENMIRVHRVLNDWETKTIPLDMKLPQRSYDSVNVLFWNGNSDKTIWVDNIEAFSFNE